MNFVIKAHIEMYKFEKYYFTCDQVFCIKTLLEGIKHNHNSQHTKICGGYVIDFPARKV